MGNLDGIGKDLYNLFPEIYRTKDHSFKEVTTDPEIPEGVLAPLTTPLWDVKDTPSTRIYPDELQPFLMRFLRIFGDVTDNAWVFVERLMLLQDADEIATMYIDNLASNLGMDLDESFDVATRRLLIKNCTWFYKHKGTNLGIIGAIKRLTGLDVLIDEWNSYEGYWHLHDDETSIDPKEDWGYLGVDTFLGIGGQRWWMLDTCYLGIDTILGEGTGWYLDDKEWEGIYTFVVYVYSHCDAELLRLIDALVNYMKPIHTHHIIKCVYDMPEYTDYHDWIIGDYLLSRVGVSTVIGDGISTT
jgi:phage tail-like protein